MGSWTSGRWKDEKLSSEMELRAGLIVLKYAPQASGDNLEEVVTWVLTWLHGVPRELFLLAVRYMLRAYGLSWGRFESVSRRIMDEREQEMVGQAARELIAEGEVRGEVKGAVKGKAEALVLVLERRFGKLPSDLLRRVSEAKAAQLEGWLERAADGATLDAIFGAPSKH